jgi:hypothetical protein
MGMSRRRRPALPGALLAAALACARTPTRDAARPPAPADDAGARAAATERPAPPDAATPADREGPPAPPGPAADPGASVAGDRPPATPAALREAVSGVASSRGGPAHGVPRALQAIAGMLEQVAGGAPAPAEGIRRMRAETDALVRLGAIDLERADRVKDALERGAEALRALARDRGAAPLGPWVDAAAAAVDAIDPATPLGLQRAAVQDALRALADAVLVVEQFAGR